MFYSREIGSAASQALSTHIFANAIAIISQPMQRLDLQNELAKFAYGAPRLLYPGRRSNKKTFIELCQHIVSGVELR